MIEDNDIKTARQDDSGLFEILCQRLRELAGSPLILTLWMAVTGIALIAQPYDSYGKLPLWAAGLYWGGIVAASICVADIVDCVVRRLTPDGNRMKITAKAILLVTIGFSPVIILWNELFVLGFPDMKDNPWLIAFRVFATSIPVFVLMETVRAQMGGLSPHAERASGPVECEAELRPRLAARLQHPEHKILRLTANNHQIDVISAEGREQVRMRFADAVREMEPVPGCCVHRSHWVTLEAVVGLSKRKDKLFVRLNNGDEIPVSRTYRPELEAARPDLF